MHPHPPHPPTHSESRVAPPPIRLRRITPDDLPALFEMQSDPVCNDMAGTKPRTRLHAAVSMG